METFLVNISGVTQIMNSSKEEWSDFSWAKHTSVDSWDLRRNCSAAPYCGVWNGKLRSSFSSRTDATTAHMAVPTTNTTSGDSSHP